MNPPVGPRVKRLIILACLHEDPQWRTNTLPPGSILRCDSNFFGAQLKITIEADELCRYQGEFVLLGLSDQDSYREWVVKELCRADACELDQTAPASV